MNRTLEDILDFDAIKELLEAFCEITGTAAALLDTKGKIFIAVRWQRACSQFHRACKESEKNCVESDTKMLGSLMSEDATTLYHCKNGLCDAAFPIKIAGKHIANMFIGQFLLEPMDEDFFRKQAKKFGYDEEKYIEAMSEVTVIDNPTVMKYTKFLKLMTQLVTQVGYDKYSIKQLLGENLAHEHALHETKIRQKQIVDALDSMIIGVDDNMNVAFLNKRAIDYVCVHTQADKKKLVGQSVYRLFPKFKAFIKKLRKTIQDGAPLAEDTFMVGTPQGTEAFNVGLYPFSGARSGAVIRIDDKTRDFETNRMLQHSQKMAALGQLAGGVAHDFNNMLTGIQGATQLLAKEVAESSPKAKKWLGIITKAADRTADLTAKLLAVSRKNPEETLKNANIDIASILNDVVAILAHSVKATVKVTLTNNTSNAFVFGNKSTLESAFLNVGINASHAIEGRGEIKFCLDKVELDDQSVEKLGVQPGYYLKVDIQDTGKGIPPVMLEKIFEPFYTTKEHGTGLGLAMVYSTVASHHGHISVNSVVGEGTWFTFYLPCSEAVQDDKKQQPISSKSARGTILFVDDEEVVRCTGEYLLDEIGYKVITATNGSEAIRIFEDKRNEIDIVFSDIVMPVMDGRKLARLIKEKSPDTKVVLTSAFHHECDNDAPNGCDAFVQKPYQKSDLQEAFDKL